MNLTFYNLKGFKELASEEEQLKEIFFIYGVCMSRFALIDSFFSIKLLFNKFEFEGNQIGKIYSKDEREKIQSHYNDKATTGMLIKDFKDKYDTSKFDALFDETLRVRNMLAHKYMRLNWQELPNKELREEIYEDLLGVFNFLNEFDTALINQPFATRANNAFCIRWTGKSQSK